MLATLGIIWREPNLRLAALLLIGIGAGFASIGPFQSLIAVEVLGISDGVYAAILALEALIAVTSSVYVGVLTDSRTDRRTMAVLAAVITLVSTTLMAIWPTSLTFFLAHALLYPLTASLFSQTFALTRLASEGLPPAERDAVLSSVRAFLAVPFIIVLPIWSAVFAAGAPLLVVYKVVLLVHVALILLIWRHWPSDRTAGWVTAKSSATLMQGLRELAAGPVLLRVAAVGAIISGQPIYMAVLGLTFEGMGGRPPAHTALFFGFVAGLEIPVMFWMGALLRLFRRRTLIAAGAMFYGLFLILLPVLLTSPLVWLLVIPAAVGGGIILSLPIAYMQDLLSDRPGAGGSLIAVQRVISQGIAAAVFAFGTAISGYGLVAALAGAGMIASVGLFLWLERDR